MLYMPGQDKPSAVPLLSQPVWLQLSSELRAKLVRLFGLKRSGATETYMGRNSIVRVVSDGYTAGDLLAVTTAKMQELLGSDSKDFYGLFDDVIANVDALLDGTFLTSGTEIVEETIIKDSGKIDDEGNITESISEVVEIKKKRGRPAKNK